VAVNVDPARVRSIAERLVGIASVSPDPVGESRCGRAVLEALPDGLERGAWRLRDRREVVWARLHGRGGQRGVLLLGHHDTVGVTEYAGLGAVERERIAFQPDHLRAVLEVQAPALEDPAAELLREDLGQPADWMFGRGALDMKGGLAAGAAALGLLAEGDRPGGDVMFISCPDEEHESAGMLQAVGELARIRTAGRLDLIGAINLDYSAAPVAYSGVMAKRLVGIYVLGSPTHASAPHDGADAAQLAAAIVERATTSPALVEKWGRNSGPPAVALRLRDLKSGYNVQTAVEAAAELNLMGYARTTDEVMATLRGVVAEAVEDVARRMDTLQTGKLNFRRASVLTYPDLAARAGTPPEDGPLAGTLAGTLAPGKTDARATTLERVRALVREARIAAPAVVLYLLPPFHPHVPPGDGPLTAATREVLQRGGHELVPYYPNISDASYLAWRAESPEMLGRHLPALGHDYVLPADDSRALGLEVVNLGPWGRDAHGLFERVYTPYAFDTLPRMLAELIRIALKA
jgi:arginine utilization protein RocB